MTRRRCRRASGGDLAENSWRNGGGSDYAPICCLGCCLGSFSTNTENPPTRQSPVLTPDFMELARGIEPPTCGLQNRSSPLSYTSLTVTVCTDVTDIPKKPNNCVYDCQAESVRGGHRKCTGSLFHRPEMILSSILASPLLEGHPCWSTCGRRTRLQMLPPSLLVSSFRDGA